MRDSSLNVGWLIVLIKFYNAKSKEWNMSGRGAYRLGRSSEIALPTRTVCRHIKIDPRLIYLLHNQILVVAGVLALAVVDWFNDLVANTDVHYLSNELISCSI